MQGYAVTLTFKVATQMLLATRRPNIVIISVKKFENGTSNNQIMGQTWFCCKVHDFIQGYAVTLTFKVATQMMRVHIVHIATY